MIRHFTGWLWRFFTFRLFVIRWCGAGLWGAGWLAVNTPFLWVLRAHLDMTPGHASVVAEIDKKLREDRLRRG